MPKEDHQKHLMRFNEIVSLLKEHGFTKSQIASEMGVTKLNKENRTVANLQAFNKIEKDELFSYKKIPLEAMIKLIENAPIFKKVFQPDHIDISLYTHAFFLFYWSNRNEIGLAFIGIEDKDLSKSSFIYLQRNKDGHFVPLKTRLVASFSYTPHKVLEIIIHKKEGAPKTFLTVDIAGGDIEDVRFAYCSFCGSMSSNKGVYSGIGIIENIDSHFFNNRIKQLNDHVPSSIINALYNRRNNVEHSELGLYENENEIRNKQINAIRAIQGYWVGYYPRKHIEVDGIEGGLSKVIMHIEASGVVKIYFKSVFDNNVIIPNYTGVIRFPFSRKSTLIVGELEHFKGTHRIRLLLNSHKEELTGNMSGWRDEDGSLFSRAILFESIKTEPDHILQESLTSLIDTHNPRGYSINEMMSFVNQIKSLKKIEEKSLHTLENCISGTIRKTVTQLNLFLDETK